MLSVIPESTEEGLLIEPPNLPTCGFWREWLGISWLVGKYRGEA